MEDNKFVARQAILNKEKVTLGYELLYRNSLDNFYTGESPEQSTSQIIFQNHIMGSIEELCMNKLAFINFDQKSLLAKLPLFLDKKNVVIELLETLDVIPDIIDVVSELFTKGYKIALDDYNFSEQWDSLIPYVSFIKIDREDISIERIQSLINSKLVKKYNIKVLVERVETEEQFNTLKSIGVDYYQGYFFHKPEIKLGCYIEPGKLNLLSLFVEINKPCIEFNAISEIISHDVALVSGVLKLVNLKSEKNRIPINSVKQAVTFLGADKIKQFVAVIAMSRLSSDSVSELLLESITRAKMMELLSTYKYFSSIKQYAFMVGLLSNISAILECPLSKIILDLPLAKEIIDALLEQKGLLYEALELSKYFERSIKIANVENTYGISEDDLLNEYHNALKWCSSIYC